MTKHEFLSILERTKEILSEPESWQKGSYAKDFDGHSVPPADLRAVCWCMVGAIERASAELYTGELSQQIAMALDINDQLFLPLYSKTIVAFNDSPDTEHSDVLTALDLMIEKVKYDSA